jgi:hypothetical protein
MHRQRQQSCQRQEKNQDFGFHKAGIAPAMPVEFAKESAVLLFGYP